MRVLTAFVYPIFLFGCNSEGFFSEDPDNHKPPIGKPVVIYDLSVSSDTSELLLHGEPQRLKAVGRYTNGDERDVSDIATWHSSDETVLIVNEEGVVTPMSYGSAFVFATLSGLQSEDVVLEVIGSFVCGDLSNTSPIDPDEICLHLSVSDDEFLLSSPPTRAVMEYLGFTQSSGNYNPVRTFNRYIEEDGVEFALFDQLKPVDENGETFDEGGQFWHWCGLLDEFKFMGRDWGRVSFTALQSITFPNRLEEWGWPHVKESSYWAREPSNQSPTKMARVKFDTLGFNYQAEASEAYHGMCQSLIQD